VNRGGAGSGKSHAVAQVILDDFFNGIEKKILILRKSLPALRQSTLILMNQLINDLGVRNHIIEEKVHLNWYYEGNLIHFGSLDDPEKLKSSEWNKIWMEEATEFTFDDFKIAKLRVRAPSKDGRPNNITLSFNPIDEFHWIKEKLLNDPTQDCVEIVSTYLDNPFLPAQYIEQLESLREQDPVFWQIYAKGQWGKLENLIYKNWDIIDWEPPVSLVESVLYGLDFGYNDPSVLVRVMRKGKDIYERQLLYQSKLTNADLIERMHRLIPQEEKRFMIYADAAEPDRIMEIRRAGFRIKEASKNILDGIDQVKRYNVHIHADSTDIIKEKRAYSWRKDRNGNILDVPVDFLNHAMDAERYAIYSGMRGGGIKVRFIN